MRWYYLLWKISITTIFKSGKSTIVSKNKPIFILPQTSIILESSTTTSWVPQGGHISPLLFSIFINIANRILKHDNLLAFADDMKLFFRINSLNDCHKLQSYLNCHVLYRLIFLNDTLCVFIHRRRPFCFDYDINGSILSSLEKSITDLGFVFTPTLSPRLHTENIYCKTLKTLGFIKRFSTEFKLLYLQALYYAFVRRTLE